MTNRTVRLMPALALAAGLALSAPALAEEHGTAGQNAPTTGQQVSDSPFQELVTGVEDVMAPAAQAVEAVEHQEASLPQLNPEWFPSQIFWLIVTFVILYVVLSRNALPRVSEVLEERQDRIDGDLQKAADLKAESQRIIADYEAKLAKARGEAQAVLKESGEALAAESAKAHADTTARLGEQAAAAEKRIAEAKSTALGEIQTMVGDVTKAAVDRLVGYKVPDRTLDTAVKGAMKEHGHVQ